MKVIKFNMDLRLNPQDEHVVPCPSFLPYSEENLEYAKEKYVDGNVTIEELPKRNINSRGSQYYLIKGGK